MGDKLMYIPDDDNQNYPLSRLKIINAASFNQQIKIWLRFLKFYSQEMEELLVQGPLPDQF